jgi:hypothetical protein
VAGYVPKELRIPTAVTASYATVYTATAVTGIMRTFAFNVLTTTHNAFLSREAGGEATVIVENQVITPGVPLTQNGWWVVPASGILQAKADAITTNAPNFGAWGYEWT